jgi:Zn-dependent membrane protease YugP
LAAIIIVLALVFTLAVLPQLWVRRVIAAHDAERADFPGTGGEFARHILDEMKLGHVKVEETDAGDHYDPEAKAIRLLPKHFGGKSLAAVVIAAHETGHAMQDAVGYPPCRRARGSPSRRSGQRRWQPSSCWRLPSSWRWPRRRMSSSSRCSSA